MSNTLKALQNHRGRFTSLSVNRVKGGNTKYSAKIVGLTDKTLTFWDRNTGRELRVPLANVVA